MFVVVERREFSGVRSKRFPVILLRAEKLLDIFLAVTSHISHPFLQSSFQES
jgi:hypothetical protein